MRRVSGRAYRAGDLVQIPSAEQRPFSDWIEYVEQAGHGLTTYELDGHVLASIGFTSCWDGVGDAFAVVNRQMAAGHGRILAAMVKARIKQVMQVYGLHRMQATCEAADHAGRVFLRAVGFRFESVIRQGAPDRTDLLMHAILEEMPDDQQAQENHQENRPAARR